MTETVRVRMYRQGLGDCFLLTFPRPGGEAHVLIDCGVLVGTKDPESKMRIVARNIVETTNGEIDVLVVTHEHWDHISGFLQAEEIFEQLGIRQIWLAWTEDPADELAIELGERKRRALRAVDTVARLLERTGEDRAKRSADRLRGLLQFHGDTLGLEGDLGAAERKTTARAMKWVKEREEKKRARLCYLVPGDSPIPLPGVEGVRVFVLGPPRDKKLLKRSDPRKSRSEVYELARAQGDLGFLSAVEAIDGSADARQPFDEWFRLDDREQRKDRLFANAYLSERFRWRQIEHDWMEAAGRLALDLDSDTNNTCLVLAFELVSTGRVLLFPGDAQVGNWLSWEDLEWKLRQGDETVIVKAKDLLARTVLYKVGHHGSHNATLREKGLELMSSRELAAMIPVSRETARKKKWKMPFPALLRRLEQKTGGRIVDRDMGVAAMNTGALTQAEWRQFTDSTDVQEMWIDYRIPV